MKKYFLCIYVLILGYLHSDIAPNPIYVNGIINTDSTEVQMVSEIVIADVYKDTTFVECNFVLKNHSESTSLACGFPVMSFYYWFGFPDGWKPEDENFQVWVNNKEITQFERYLPKYIIDKKEESDLKSTSFWNDYRDTLENIRDSLTVVLEDSLNIKKLDYTSPHYKTLWVMYEKEIERRPILNSRRDEMFRLQTETGYVIDYENTPWYIWNLAIANDEIVSIRVNYKVPTGLGYSGTYRFFKYIIHTGSGWFLNIERADIIIKLHDFEMNTIEDISPENSIIDSLNKTITWSLLDIEPKIEDNIYVRFYDPEERSQYEKDMKDWERKRKWSFLNYINPIYWIKRMYWAIY